MSTQAPSASSTLENVTATPQYAGPAITPERGNLPPAQASAESGALNVVDHGHTGAQPEDGIAAAQDAAMAPVRAPQTSSTELTDTASAMDFSALQELLEENFSPEQRSEYWQLTNGQKRDYTQQVYDSLSEVEKRALQDQARELQAALAQSSLEPSPRTGPASSRVGDTPGPSSQRLLQLDHTQAHQAAPMDEDSDDELPDVRQIFSQRPSGQQTPTRAEDAGVEAVGSDDDASELIVKTERGPLAQLQAEEEAEAGPSSQRSVGTSTLGSYPASPATQEETVGAAASSNQAEPLGAAAGTASRMRGTMPGRRAQRTPRASRTSLGTRASARQVAAGTSKPEIADTVDV